MTDDPLGLTPAQRLEGEIWATLERMGKSEPLPPPEPLYGVRGCDVYEGDRFMARAVTEDDAQYIATQLNLEPD